MKKLVVVLILVILPALLIGRFLLNDGTGDTPEWNIRNLRIWKQTPVWELAQAVKWQDTGKIVRLAKAHPEWLNYQEPRYGATLLIWAVGVEKYNSAKALLECGADPNIATKDAGETALFVAASYSWIDYQAKKDPKYVKLLLKFGANPNINYSGFKSNAGSDVTESGTSPLMESIGCGIEKTKALVEGGADINYKTADGMSATLLAIWKGKSGLEESLEYAYYLIVVKKAKVTDPWLIKPDNPTEPMVKIALVSYLREWVFPLDSKAYSMKMAIVNEFARQGANYWKTTISDKQLKRIQKLYPDTWQEYIKTY